MKKFTLLAVLAAALTFSCSDDDGGSTGTPDSYSAHMKDVCPGEGVLSDVCVTEAVWDYLAAERTAAGVNNCCWVEFEDLDGNLVEGWLIRVEKNQIDCNPE